jgi:hypothetical protein
MGKRGPKPCDDTLAAGAERQPEGAPVRKLKDRRTRVQRWRDAVAELVAIQKECEAWLDILPLGTMSATAEALRAICDLDLSDLEVIEPPRGHRKIEP